MPIGKSVSKLNLPLNPDIMSDYSLPKWGRCELEIFALRINKSERSRRQARRSFDIYPKQKYPSETTPIQNEADSKQP